MPKGYSHSGSTDQPIKKIYNNNGSNDIAVKKAYSFNGTTHELIWQDKTYLIENGIPTDFSQGFKLIQQQYGSTWEPKNGYIEFVGLNSGTRGRVDCNNKNIDYTKYTKLCIEMKVPGGNPQNNFLDIGLGANGLPEHYWLPTESYGNVMRNISAKNENKQVHQFDIRDVQKVGMFILAVNNATPKYQIYNIWLE